jgi:hypothetical protein
MLCKNVENQNNSENQCKETNDGGQERINAQERIPCWAENDPTVIIHAQESRAFESKSLNTGVTTVDSAPGRLLRHRLIT